MINIDNYIDLMGFNIFSKSKEKCLEEIFSREKINIVSGNPEIIYSGIKNSNLESFFKDEKSLIIPDGIGVKIGAKILGKNIDCKIAGIEVMDEILSRYSKENKSVYFLGAEEDVIFSFVENIRNKYPSLNISGFHNGFWKESEEETIISKIKECNPDGLFVALGCPKQELFIKKYMDILECHVFMGVGGSFDVVSGKIKRAPGIFIKLNLEWFYRIMKEPKRIVRLGVIFKFLLYTIVYKFKK